MIKQEQPSLTPYQKIKNIKNNSLSILETILDYTSTLKKRTPSVFDNHSDINVVLSNLDNYDFEDLFRFCVKIFKINDNLLVLIMMYIDKIISNGNLILCEKNINKLFYTCLMITQKYYEDNSFNNKTYAKLVCISCDELLEMEMEFMNMINFELFIKDEDFEKYKEKITKFYS